MRHLLFIILLLFAVLPVTIDQSVAATPVVETVEVMDVQALEADHSLMYRVMSFGTITLDAGFLVGNATARADASMNVLWRPPMVAVA